MILVTGASGFLGSELVKQLLAIGKPVKALKRQSSAIPEILKDEPNLVWVDGDVSDYFSLENAFIDVSQVYHCAAMISFNPADKKAMIKVNAEGTAHIVNLCLSKNVQKLLHVSSVAAVGEARGDQFITEKDHWEFNGEQGAYSISKYSSEMEVYRGIAEGLNAVIINPSVFIGKNAGIAGSGAIFQLVKKGLSYYPPGSIGLVDVKDVAKSMIVLMESETANQRYIINAENWTYRDLFTTIADEFGVKPPAKPLKTWMANLAVTVASLIGYLKGKPAGFTKEIAKSAFKSQNYANHKILKETGIQFISIRESIAEICAELLQKQL